MSVPALPEGFSDLQAYLQDIEDRLAKVETPQGPTLLYPMASAKLTLANAATYISCAVFVTDLLVIGYSSGAHWYRSDTGAVII